MFSAVYLSCSYTETASNLYQIVVSPPTASDIKMDPLQESVTDYFCRKNVSYVPLQSAPLGFRTPCNPCILPASLPLCKRNF